MYVLPGGPRKLGKVLTELQPTVDVFEKRIAALEGGIGALAASFVIHILFICHKSLIIAFGSSVLAKRLCSWL